MTRGRVDAELLTAYHEAGHAVMAQLCGQQITAVEIVGDAEHTGTTEALRFPADPVEAVSDDVRREAVACRLQCALAGVVAESMVSGGRPWDDTSGDLDEAVRLAMKLVDDCEEVLPLLEEVGREVERRLAVNWPAVEGLAAELQRRKRLSGLEVRKILGAAG